MRRKRIPQPTDKETAEAHWKWLETWLHIVYVDAMVHGMKHGREGHERLDVMVPQTHRM